MEFLRLSFVFACGASSLAGVRNAQHAPAPEDKVFSAGHHVPHGRVEVMGYPTIAGAGKQMHVYLPRATMRRLSGATRCSISTTGAAKMTAPGPRRDSPNGCSTTSSPPADLTSAAPARPCARSVHL
jgi:hypothetical protein